MSCPKKRVAARSFGRMRRLPDGTLQFQKKGWEPPPEPEGFKRDPKDAWHFLPVWPECDQRRQTTVIKQCGAIKLLTICNHPESRYTRQEVSLGTCQGCPLHK